MTNGPFRDHGASPRGWSAELIVLVLVCAAYIGWILSLPLFPTQDGPVHLYYVHIMQALFSGQPTPYAHFYYIKHLLPPYSLYYYSLIGLAKFVPLLLADRLVICFYFVSFLFGFRYLARSVGPGADRMTLLVTLLLLNWPLGMGFVNFCLSITFGLWAIGNWVRFEGRSGFARRAVFLLLTIIITLTHPVPLLFVLAFCGLSLLVHLLQHRREKHPSSLPPSFSYDLLTLLLAGSVLGYVKLFTSVKILQQTKQATSTLSRFVHSIQPPVFIAGQGFSARVYLGLLLVALAVSLLYAGLHWRAARLDKSTSGNTIWFFVAVGFLVALPLMPHDLNGSHYFSDRLTIFAWLLALVAASAYTPRWRFERPALILFVVASNIFILYLAETNTRPVAKTILAVQNTSIQHRGEVGIALRDQEPDYLSREDTGISLAYDPYLWAPLHHFRANDAILYNTPWLDLEIIPLGGKASLANRPLTLTALETPSLLVVELQDAPAKSTTVLSNASFAIVDVGSTKRPTALPPSLQADSNPARPWTCSAPPASWYKICEHGQSTR
jgi:hypothetical protein